MAYNFPKKIKQIILLPDHCMMVEFDRDDKKYHDDSYYGVLGYLVVENGDNVFEDGSVILSNSDEVFFGTINEEGYGLTQRTYGDRRMVIPAYKCPVCGNRMAVMPFRANDEHRIYYCKICESGKEYVVEVDK